MSRVVKNGPNALEAIIAEIRAQEAHIRLGGGKRGTDRQHKRGRLTARERIELLLDPDSPFLELSPLAAYGSEFNVGAVLVTGIGVVSGVECVIIAHDPTVRGGSMNPYTLKKNLRAFDIARENRLPVINLVESGGADLRTQADLFIPAGNIFRNLTQLSGLGIPTIALVFGTSTAGGAYVPAMCDESIIVRDQGTIFLGGPPLVKAATGEEVDAESLGGGDVHTRKSGVADYLANNDEHALAIAREVISHSAVRFTRPLAVAKNRKSSDFSKSWIGRNAQTDSSSRSARRFWIARPLLVRDISGIR